MKISAYRADSETSRIERLTRFEMVLDMYRSTFHEGFAEISFLHDHKGHLSVGFATKPSDDQIKFISSAWQALENEPNMGWVVADEYSDDLQFVDCCQ